MIFDIKPDDLKRRLEKYLMGCKMPQWGTSERTFTLKLAGFEKTPEGIAIFYLNRIAFEIEQGKFVFDPKVNTPVIALRILSHPKGAFLKVVNTSKRFDVFIEQIFSEVVK